MPTRAPKAWGRRRSWSGSRPSLEQQVVDDGLVLVGDVGDGRRQCEHDMIVRHRQQIGLAPASQSFAAAPWHFGQCRLRQELYAMMVWAQSSQRATCPPSAAVRQFSIADITLSWPRLTWPALARRHAGPWPRKMSATSSVGRDICAALQAGGSAPSLSLPAMRSSGLLTSLMVLVATRV